MGNMKKRKSNKKKKRNKNNKLLPSDNTEIIKNDEDNMDEQQTSPHEVIRRKRANSDADSDVEEKPKKKKKKNTETQGEGPQGKGKKSNRQIKKEKFAQRQAEAASVAKDALKQQCLNYLSQWKHARDHWKFMKSKQVWLYKNKFSSKLVPDESWSLLLEYFESAKGNIKNMLLEDANKVVKQMDDCLEKEASSKGTEEAECDEDETEPSKPDDTSYKRARDIIQHLQE